MENIAVTVTEKFIITSCADCGVRFGVTERYDNCRRHDKALFYCPNGHGMSFKESEADKLRRERDLLKQNEARLLDEQAWLNRQREAAEKDARQLRKKAAQAACPCCAKTFGNLRAHLARKHPEFVAEAA